MNLKKLLGSPRKKTNSEAKRKHSYSMMHRTSHALGHHKSQVSQMVFG